jgi:hypothetical protein
MDVCMSSKTIWTTGKVVSPWRVEVRAPSLLLTAADSGSDENSWKTIRI